MLVSSIGYFDVKKNSNTDYSAKNQSQKTISAERFGQFDKNPVTYAQPHGFIRKVVNSFKMFSAANKSENSASSKSFVA